ncbi:MAG TPA: alanine racemase [Thermoanaerobaculia bacterium]|nr:alanine racemase [Thermoanaerobaculia bacterium]
MSTVPELRPTWVTIDRAAFARNIASIADSLPSRSRLVVVLKADAYGHGAVELARVCTDERVAMLATALLEESLELRDAGITLPLLVFGALTAPQIVIAIDNNITIGVPGPEELAEACAVARDRDLAIHLKLDSGMGRMGVTEAELPRAIEVIRATPRLRVDAIYTHFANADANGDSFTETQLANFDRMLATLRDAGINPPLHHSANSGATLRGIVRDGDWVRCGIALYGPEPLDMRGINIEPVLTWRTEIVRLKELPPGHAIGYGTTFHTTRASRIATLPVGYADGYSRALSNKGEVLVRGRRAPVAGRVSMDLVTIDVTGIPDAALHDEVILLGESITAEELAAKTDTISYEVFCRITKRVPRRYQ